jgi:hypothetical protein
MEPPRGTLNVVFIHLPRHNDQARQQGTGTGRVLPLPPFVVPSVHVSSDSSYATPNNPWCGENVEAVPTKDLGWTGRGSASRRIFPGIAPHVAQR